MRCDACQTLTGKDVIDHPPHSGLRLVEQRPYRGAWVHTGGHENVYECQVCGGFMSADAEGDPFAVWVNR